ncbi:MAG: PQQ-binding-like beta-propeller repeat protein, partial [Phormidium sp.]
MMTADVAAKNQKTLQQLAQAMALSRGHFKLILVRCNYGQACERWSKDLTQLCQDQYHFSLTAVHLPPNAQNLAQAVQAIEPSSPEGVQVLGLNQLADVRQFLANSNQIRDRLRRDCPVPMAIWLDDNSLTEMLNLANDLHSWATSKRFYPTPDDLEQELHHLLDLFFQRLPQASPEQWLGSQPLLSQSEQRELDLAQTELNRDLSPSLQADLAIIQSHQHLLQQQLSQAEQQLNQGANLWQTITPPTPTSQKRLGWLAFQQAILPLWRSEQEQIHLHYPELHPLNTYFQESQQHFQAAAEPDLAHLVANAAVVQLVSHLSEITREITHPETSPNPARFDHLAAVNEQLCQQESFPFPNLWLNALEQLHQFYFHDRQDYRRAFSIQQQQWQVQRYGGQRAFVGASRLQGILYQRCSLDNLPPEIQESGREEDVRNLQGRLSGTQNKILVIHGQSGVGKSSLINAGLLPVLREKTFSGGLEGVPILVRLYQPWTETLETAIDQTSQRHKKSLAGISQGSPQQRIAAKLQALEKQHCQVILVFDQFEEFFFANPGQPDHEEFFGFIGGLCSNIQQLGALKVVFSLRTDYVGQLLLCNDLDSMDCIGRDILSRQVLHKLGNLSPQRTSQVLAKLAPHLEADLRTRLVADLSQETGAVRPIELQLVGFQLESQQIREMSAYEALGEHPKQQLVQGYLDDIVRACGAEQERLANGVLYLLTDERRRRPLRSYEELWQDLQPIPQAPQGQALQDALDLVLEIFTASGLVVVIPGEPQRYQLVHDYLAELIYESRQSDLIASLHEEQRKRLAAERTLEELEQRQTQVKRRTRWLSAVGVVVIAVSSGAAVWGNRELNTARLITRLERNSRLALQQFERNDELEALLTATRTARELQQTTPSDQNYRTVRPIESLSGVLRDIRLRNTWQAHSGEVTSAEFNRDGTRVVSASSDGTVKLWDVRSGELLHSFEAHSGPVTSAEFNGDGTRVVSASNTDDGTIKLWDVDTGELLHSLEAHSNTVWSAEFDRDGTKVVSASDDGTVKLWDVDTGDLLHSFESYSGGFSSAKFNRDGTRVVSASSDGTVKLWDVTTGELLHSLEAHSDSVTSAEFNRNGTRVVSASDDGTVKLWDVDTGELLHSLEAHSRGVYSAKFNGDGTRVVSASGAGTVKLWDVDTGHLLHSFEAHSGPVRTVWTA